MKPLLLPVLAGLALACAQSAAQAPEFKERIRKEFTVAAGGNAGTLVIYNVNGFIKVEGTAGNQVTLDVDKHLTADDPAELNRGKQELKLVFEQKGDTILAYIAEPFDTRPHRNRWEGRNDWRNEYDFTLDFTVKVPRQMNLHVSTVNRGDVQVRDVAGALKVRNVNGAIALTNARGATDAHTINGNVEANYLAAPASTSSYYTLNGDIRVTYPTNLSADLTFKTFQGEFYTDFPGVETLPARVVKNERRQGDKTTYKLDKTTAIRIGKGGQTLRFETFNGSVYLKKQS